MEICDKYYRIYASINLDAIEENIDKLKALVKVDTKMVAVIKADGYGHGAGMIARYAAKRVDMFAVATIEEALYLRKNNIDRPIIVLGYVNEARYREMIENDIRFTVFKADDAKKIDECSADIGKKAYIHIKADTGMGRIGFSALNNEDITMSANTISQFSNLSNLVLEGIYTHFALSDSLDKSFCNDQFNRFIKLIETLEKKGIYFSIRHCSNSAAILDVPKANMDAVRAGIAMYGLEPSPEVDIEKIGLKQAMELKSHIVYIKTVEENTSIGYGRTYYTAGVKKIATIPVGYGDGYPRNLSNKGYVLIHGKKAPIVGRICMDQFMVDVTEIPEAMEGDIVTIAGWDNGQFLGITELANAAGTFNYEFICDIGKRVPRVYIYKEKIVGTKDYFFE